MNSSVKNHDRIILFDGVCNFCASSVQFVINRDSQKKFRFASLQSNVASELLGSDNSSHPDLESMVLLDQENIYRKSSAALHIAKQLDGLWPILSIFLVIPCPIRDAVYDWIGRHRYQWFGKKEVCWVPDANLRDLFLDQP